ncbi:hypothetical protein F4821DRAFT_257564 [Hypoxylon rubiginosum]|uniref:Uncharacterized protein n=1 Tax=Hypoxylon rubiginosum TaxID=110542 RepID=A0ACC0D7N4_9PEZI|nr:hypothetical protein F4821DRAFT_257564 [Hypoxylon rubiginosum]
MAPTTALVIREFDIDVYQRGVVNPASDHSCTCGSYQYYSQKCGCLYKTVLLKCGKTHSKKGNTVLCREGRGRKVRVFDAMVPFNCAQCRRNNGRWKGQADDHQHQDDDVKVKEEKDQVTIKEED